MQHNSSQQNFKSWRLLVGFFPTVFSANSRPSRPWDGFPSKMWSKINSKIYAKVTKNRSRNQAKHKNEPQNDPKWWRNEVKTRNATFLRPSYAQIGSGTAPPGKTLIFFRLFGRKCRSKGRFSDPPKFQNGSKIALLRQDRHLDPLKMVSGRGFGTNRKMDEKMIEKRTKNHVKIVLKFIEKLILFRTCDFSFFAKSPMLKWEFYKSAVSKIW